VYIFVSVLEKQKLEEIIEFSERKLHEKHMRKGKNNKKAS